MTVAPGALDGDGQHVNNHQYRAASKVFQVQDVSVCTFVNGPMLIFEIMPSIIGRFLLIQGVGRYDWNAAN
jgi:hypothetical protein